MRFHRYTKAKGHRDTGRVQIAARLDEEVFAAINEAAQRNNVSVSEALRRVTRHWFERTYSNRHAERREAGE